MHIEFPLYTKQYRRGDFQSPLWQSEIAATFNVKRKCLKEFNGLSTKTPKI